MKSLAVLFLSLFTVSCGGNNSIHDEPEYYLQGSFDPALVNQVVELITKIAASYGAKAIEKDRDEMKYLTFGKEAFFIAFYINDINSPILLITNGGAAEYLTLMAMSTEDISDDELSSLVDAISAALRKEYGVELKAINSESD